MRRRFGAAGARSGGKRWRKRTQDALGFRYLIECTVRDDEELGRFERRFGLHNTVLGNPGTVQGSTECAQTANYDSAFQSADDPADTSTTYRPCVARLSPPLDFTTLAERSSVASSRS